MDKKQETQVFKFRAECLRDVYDLTGNLSKENIVGEMQIENLMAGDVELPDLVVVIELANTTLEDLRDVARSVIDGHVMGETVQLEKNYTGIRAREMVQAKIRVHLPDNTTRDISFARPDGIFFVDLSEFMHRWCGAPENEDEWGNSPTWGTGVPLDCTFEILSIEKGKV